MAHLIPGVAIENGAHSPQTCYLEAGNARGYVCTTGTALLKGIAWPCHDRVNHMVYSCQHTNVTWQIYILGWTNL